MKWISWNIIWTSCFGNKNLEMKQFTAYWWFYVSYTNSFLSTKVSLENGLVLFSDWSNRFSHPVSQVNSMQLRIKFGLSTNLDFKLVNRSVRIKYFLNYCILRYILEFRLKFSLNTNVTLDGYLSSFYPELDELFSKVKL